MKRFLQVALALAIAGAVIFVSFLSGDDPAPVLPSTETQFSLDLEVGATADHDLVYAVEQRARPAYRILSLDPRSGDIETVFTVPEDAIIYGIALNQAKDTIAVAYSPDFALGGNGIWNLNLGTGELEQLVPVTEGLYLTDIVWSPDGGSILATQVDRQGTEEILSAARIMASTGVVTTVSNDGINPVQVNDTVYYLTVDEEQARRSIGVLASDGSTHVLEIGDSSQDLDHLLAGDTDQSVRVAVLQTDDGGIAIGEPADAHGNHNVASSWWNLAVDASAAESLDLEPTTVYDAASSGNAIVYATLEGLAITSDTSRIDLITSRAIRFVAA